MTEPEAYMHGNSYEFFIRRAFKCERDKNGASTALLQFLIIADMGKNSLFQPYDKQFAKVKDSLQKAIQKFLKRNPTEIEKIQLERMSELINSAYSATDLVPIIENGLEATIRYRDL